MVPSDVHYICAYEEDGSMLKANSIYGNKTWGQVGVWESLAVEIRGWGELEGDRSEKYRPNFAHGASVIADVDGNGFNEVVVVGNVYDCENEYISKYNGLFILNADRTRFKTDEYNWEEIPTDTGAPLSEDYTIIENNLPDPVVEDIDNDGIKEIIYSSYDGKVHCFSLDQKEHDHWPFTVYHSTDGYFQFASVPTVIDFNEDGYKEIIFTSWTQKDSKINGKLFIVDNQGTLLYEVVLPDSFGTELPNGALSSPTVEDIDHDGRYEIIVNTIHSGVVVYDL